MKIYRTKNLSKKFINICLLLLFLILLTTCDNEESENIYVNINETFTLKCGESVIVKPDNLDLGFYEVISDSRCPTNLRCFWEGAAEIKVWICEPGQSAKFIKLPIYGDVTYEDTIKHVVIDTLSYQLSLLQLDPYPDEFEERDYSEYEATIFISNIN
ncbi:MAG: hypothetical protein KAW56_06760 [Candidatus Marinimicrobia bacterium]|nr:hypothetical protein [Candidatus Neomarinimicrobiota bacterium]